MVRGDLGNGALSFELSGEFHRPLSLPALLLGPRRGL